MHYGKPTEGIWSLLKRSMANFAAADLDGLVRIVKRKLKKIQYRPHLIDGCLAATGLKIEPWCGNPLTFRDRLVGISVTASGQTPMAAHTVTRLRTGAGICWLAWPCRRRE